MSDWEDAPEQPTVVIGAPGTTKTDLEEGTSSLKLKPVTQGKVTTELPDDSQPKAQWEDAPWEDAPEVKGKSFGKKVIDTTSALGSEARAVFDMGLGIFGMGAGFVTKLSLAGAENIYNALDTLAGNTPDIREDYMGSARESVETSLGAQPYLTAPLKTGLAAVTPGKGEVAENNIEKAFGAVTESINNAGDQWSTKTGNKGVGELLKVSAEGLMLGLPLVVKHGFKPKDVKTLEQATKQTIVTAEEQATIHLTKELGRKPTSEEVTNFSRMVLDTKTSKEDVQAYTQELQSKKVGVDEQVGGWTEEVAKEQAEAKLAEETKAPIEDTPTTPQEAPQGVKEGEVIPEAMPEGSLPTNGKPTNIHDLGVAEQVAETVNKPPLARTTKEGKVIVDEVAAKEDFNSGFKYIFEADSPTGKQKKVVFEQLGLTKDQFKAQVKTPEDYNAFLKAHEESHVTNNDKASYPRKEDGKLDLMHPKAIEIEARATQDGLAALQTKVPKSQVGNIDPKLAIGMGVAGVGALAGAAIADDNKALGAGIGAVIGGIGAAMAMTKPKGTNPLNKVYNLPTEAPVRDLSKGAPHPAAILGEKDFNTTGKEILKLHGPEAAKEFATRYQEYREKHYVKVPVNKEDLADATYNVDTKDRLADTELTTALRDAEEAGLTTQVRAELYNALDRNQALTPEQQVAFDKFVKPVLAEIEALHSKTGTTKVEPNGPSNFFGYIPRIRLWEVKTAQQRLGKFWEDMTRTEGAFAQKMNETPDGLMERNVYVHEDIQGNRTVVQLRGDKYIFKMEKTDPLKEKGTKKDPKDKVASIWKEGDTIPSGTIPGIKNEGRLVEAKVHEIEWASDYKYSKDILLNTYIRRNELLKLDREKTFLREFTETSNFKDIGMDVIDRTTGKVNEVPSDWISPASIDRIPELAGKKFDPKVAYVLEDWAKTFENSSYLKLTSMLIKNMMLNFIPHFLNELAHLYNMRGATGWFTKGGIQSGVPTMRAGINDVLTQSKLYQDVLREGGSLLSTEAKNKQFVRDAMERGAKEAFKDKEIKAGIGEIAAKVGMKPLDMYAGLSKFSNKWMWTSRDMMYMQAIREHMAKNPTATLKDAIKEVERHLPNYRLPSTIVGSRKLAKFLGNPNVSVFSRYHYGMVRSIINTMKDVDPRHLKTKEGKEKFLHGANTLIAVALAYEVIYPKMDELAKALFGLEEMEQRRAGPYHLLHAFVEVAEGKKDPQAALAPIWTANPVGMAGAQLIFNRELYSGKQIYHPNDTSGMIAKDIGKYGMKSIPQYGPMNQAYASDTGEGTKAWLARQMDIKAKTKEQAARQQRMKLYVERERLKRKLRDRIESR